MRRWRVGKHTFIPYSNVALSLAGSGTGGGGPGDGGDRCLPLVMTPQLQQVLKLLQMSRVELEELVRKELQENPALEEDVAEELDIAEQPRAETNRESPHKPNAVDRIGTLDWQEYLDTSNQIHGSLTAEAMLDEDDSPSSWENSPVKQISLEDHLLWQLRLSKLTNQESAIGVTIIHNLDENGYLAVTIDEICAVTGRSQEEVERVLREIQFFAPVGIAARDLRECLLIQLENLPLSNRLARRIVDGYLPLLELKQYEQLAKEFGVTVDEVIEAAQLIASLEPKPSRGYEQDEVCSVLPDVFVESIGDDYDILLNDDGVPRLRITYLLRSIGNINIEKMEREAVLEALRQHSILSRARQKRIKMEFAGGRISKSANNPDLEDTIEKSTAQYKENPMFTADEQAWHYWQEKVRGATWLIKSIQQRQQTLMKVTKSIFKFQHEFLEHGVSRLKPMILRDVAEDVHMYESTISRAVANKYVSTPQGLFELKFFFSKWA